MGLQLMTLVRLANLNGLHQILHHRWVLPNLKLILNFARELLELLSRWHFHKIADLLRVRKN